MLARNQENKLNIEEVRDKLNNRFERIKRNAEEVDSVEKALNSLNYYRKPFKGRCNKCGQIGDKASDCPNKVNQGSGKLSGRCYYCGKKGHYRKDCKQRQADIKSKDKEKEDEY